MLEPTDSVAIEILSRPIPLDLPLGACSIAVATNPFGVPAHLNMHTYAVWRTGRARGLSACGSRSSSGRASMIRAA
jgi:hypothetical protein